MQFYLFCMLLISYFSLLIFAFAIQMNKSLILAIVMIKPKIVTVLIKQRLTWLNFIGHNTSTTASTASYIYAHYVTKAVVAVCTMWLSDIMDSLHTWGYNCDCNYILLELIFNFNCLCTNYVTIFIISLLYNNRDKLDHGMYFVLLLLIFCSIGVAFMFCCSDIHFTTYMLSCCWNWWYICDEHRNTAWKLHTYNNKCAA